jgi:pyruvate decarboxylase
MHLYGVHTDLPLIAISGAPNSNDNASDRILHHTIGLIDRRQQVNMFKASSIDRF